MAATIAKQLESQALEKLEEALDLKDKEDEEDEEVVEVCDFTRPLRKNAADNCSICGEGDATPDHEHVLQIELTEYYIVFCSKHEGLILRKLINNYIKRRVKLSKIGYTGPLQKEPASSCEKDMGCGT